MRNKFLYLFLIAWLLPITTSVRAQEAPQVLEPTRESMTNGDALLEDVKRVDQVLSATDQARLRHRVTLAKGLMQVRSGQMAEAMKTLEASLAAWPDSVVALTQLAELCYRDDTPRAQGYLDQTAKIDPDYYRLYFIQALVHQEEWRA